MVPVSNEYDLKVKIDPRKGTLRVRGTIIIPTSVDSAYFILNRGLRWIKTTRLTASGN